jgi:AraC-like DNA-binding protein
MGLVFDNKCESFKLYLDNNDIEEQQFGMICTNAGHTKVKPNSFYPPNINEHPVPFRSIVKGRIISEFQIGYNTRGEGIYETETAKYKITPGSMVLFLPGIKHRVLPTYGIEWHEYWVGFKGNYFSRLVDENVLSKDYIFVDANPNNYIVSTYISIFNEIIAQKPMYQLNTCSRILSLIAEFLKHKQERHEHSDPYLQIVEKAKGFMDLNLYNTVDLSCLAGDLGISVSHFNKIFRTYTSVTPYQYYINKKITTAKKMLIHDNITVKETAFHLGFEDQYYFSRLFKIKTGISPKAWKKQACFLP